MRQQLFLLILLALLYWIGNVYLHPDFMHTQDNAIYADIARNIKEGRGFQSSTALPLHFTYYNPSLDKLFPSVYPLLYPLTVAASFFIFGVSDIAAILPNLFFYIATTILIYILGQKLFNKHVAFWASIFYVLNPHVISYATQNMTEPLFTFLLTFLFFTVVQKSPKAFLTAGALVGLSALTRFQGYLLILPVFYFIFHSIDNQKKLSLFLFTISLASVLITAKIVFPPLAQDFTSLENSHLWATIASGFPFPPPLADQTITPITKQFLLENIHLVGIKILFNGYKFIKDMLTFTIPSVAILFLISFFVKASSLPQRIKNLVSITLAVFVVFHLLTIFDYRYIYPLLPMIVIFASYTLFTIFSVLASKKYVVFSITIYTIIFVILPTVAYNAFLTSLTRLGQKNYSQPTIHQIIGQIARKNTLPNAVIATDESEHIAWYADRKTVRVPRTKEDLFFIDKTLLPIDAVIITNHPITMSLGKEWDNLVASPADFGNFTFVKQFTIVKEDNYYGVPVKAVLFLKKK